jgi:hypothetical protein
MHLFRVNIFFVVFFLISGKLNANIELSKQEYRVKFEQIALNHQLEYHIPASITLAQGILESNSGNSTLAKKANNHFGIKCHANWIGEKIYLDDDAANECFRSYTSVEESFKDHSQFLKNGKRYQFLFSYSVDDYKNWAYGLKKAGYATNPEYAELLIKIIEELNLYKLSDNYKPIVSSNIPILSNELQIQIHSNDVNFIYGQTKTFYLEAIQNFKNEIGEKSEYIYNSIMKTFHDVCKDYASSLGDGDEPKIFPTFNIKKYNSGQRLSFYNSTFDSFNIILKGKVGIFFIDQNKLKNIVTSNIVYCNQAESRQRMKLLRQ